MWEGPSKKQVTVQTGLSGASCGYPFEFGESYLVYAYAGQSAPHTSLCTRTARLKAAQADMAAFERLFLGANYPEPFREKTTIAFGLPRPMEVRLEVFDRSGRLVKTLVDEHLPGETHRVTFGGSSLASGIYSYRLTTERYQAAQTMVLLQ